MLNFCEYFLAVVSKWKFMCKQNAFNAIAMRNYPIRREIFIRICFVIETLFFVQSKQNLTEETPWINVLGSRNI